MVRQKCQHLLRKMFRRQNARVVCVSGGVMRVDFPVKTQQVVEQRYIISNACGFAAWFESFKRITSASAAWRKLLGHLRKLSCWCSSYSMASPEHKSGKTYADIRDSAEKACHKHACSLQECLQRNKCVSRGRSTLFISMPSLAEQPCVCNS